VGIPHRSYYRKRRQFSSVALPTGSESPTLRPTSSLANYISRLLKTSSIHLLGMQVVRCGNIGGNLGNPQSRVSPLAETTPEISVLSSRTPHTESLRLSKYSSLIPAIPIVVGLCQLANLLLRPKSWRDGIRRLPIVVSRYGSPSPDHRPRFWGSFATCIRSWLVHNPRGHPLNRAQGRLATGPGTGAFLEFLRRTAR
jgi:hypothetical protein